jgi:glycosyltransferase involved in cell wall biosynthesis
LSFLSRLMNKFILSKSDAAVAISRQIEDYYREVVSLRKDKIYFINNGIDVELYRERNGNKLREELGIKKDEIVLGMVGNLRPEKNHKLLISAFTKVEKEVKNIHLVLAGRDFMEGEIQRFAEATGVKERIHFLGERDDVPRLLGIFDIFCLSSLYEGMPLTLLEAMASGVPVIGSDVLGINEVITDNINGLLFPKNDEKKLAELIKRLLRDNDLRKRLIQEGKSFVEKYHNLDDRIKDYDKLFQTVYQGKS